MTEALARRLPRRAAAAAHIVLRLCRCLSPGWAGRLGASVPRARLAAALRAAAVAACLIPLAACWGLPEQNRSPTLLQTNLSVASAALAAGQPAVARRLYRTLTEHFPAAPEPVLGLGYASLQADAPDEAMRHFLHAATLAGDAPAAAAEALLGAARAALATGDTRTARQHLGDARALAEDPSSIAWIENGLAVAAVLDEDYPTAEVHYRKALRQSPEHSRIAANFVRMLVASERIDEAARTYEAYASSYWGDDDRQALQRLLEEARRSPAAPYRLDRRLLLRMPETGPLLAAAGGGSPPAAQGSSSDSSGLVLLIGDRPHALHPGATAAPADPGADPGAADSPAPEAELGEAAAPVPPAPRGAAAVPLRAAERQAARAASNPADAAPHDVVRDIFHDVLHDIPPAPARAPRPPSAGEKGPQHSAPNSAPGLALLVSAPLANGRARDDTLPDAAAIHASLSLDAAEPWPTRAPQAFEPAAAADARRVGAASARAAAARYDDARERTTGAELNELVSSDEWTVLLGTSRRLQLGAAASAVATASPEIADVQLLSPTALFVIGRKLGRTTISVLGDDGLIFERAVSVVLDLEPLRVLMTGESTLRNVRVQRVGLGVALTGDVGSDATVERASRLAAVSLPESVPVENNLRVVPEVGPLRALLAGEPGLDSVRVQRLARGVALTGAVASPAAADRALRLAAASLPEGMLVENNLDVGLDLKPLRALLVAESGFQRIRAQRIARGVALSGEVGSEAAAERALRVAAASLPEGALVENNLRVVPDVEPLRTALTADPRFDRVRVQGLARGVSLGGTVTSAAAADRALGVAAASLPKDTPVENNMRIAGPQQVNLEVQIAEVQRSVAEDLGFNWELFGRSSNERGGGFRIGRPSQPSRIGLAGGVPSSVVDGQISPSLVLQTTWDKIGVIGMVDALARAGLANVLARPNVTANSGETASFFSGGEYPLPTGFTDGVIIFEYKKYGVLLDFVPTIIDEGRIELTVRPEVSEPSQDNSVQVTVGINVPVINVRRAETTVEMGDGESIVIAGLFRSAAEEVESGLPVLKDLPLLGNVFGHTSTRSEELELIVTVTARLVQAGPNPDERRAGASALANNYYY